MDFTLLDKVNGLDGSIEDLATEVCALELIDGVREKEIKILENKIKLIERQLESIIQLKEIGK